MTAGHEVLTGEISIHSGSVGHSCKYGVCETALNEMIKFPTANDVAVEKVDRCMMVSLYTSRIRNVWRPAARANEMPIQTLSHHPTIRVSPDLVPFSSCRYRERGVSSCDQSFTSESSLKDWAFRHGTHFLS